MTDNSSPRASSSNAQFFIIDGFSCRVFKLLCTFRKQLSNEIEISVKNKRARSSNFSSQVSFSPLLTKLRTLKKL